MDRWRPLGSEDWYGELTSPVDWEGRILRGLQVARCVGEDACSWREDEEGGVSGTGGGGGWFKGVCVGVCLTLLFS